MNRRHGYAPDEFDEAAAARELEAAHRPPRRPRRRALPWLAILVLAPLAAWAVFTFGVRSGVLPTPTEALDDLRARATTAEVQGAAEREEPAEVDHTAVVALLDGTAGGDAAEEAQALLEDAGYENVTTGVYRSAEPRRTTVFVRSAGEADLGADVARLLGSAAGGATPEVVESADATSSAPVVAVLR